TISPSSCAGRARRARSSASRGPRATAAPRSTSTARAGRWRCRGRGGAMAERSSSITHFLPFLRPFRRRVALIAITIVLDALFTLMRPWPLKVVVDCVLSHRSTRLPLVGRFAGHHEDATVVLATACSVTMLIAVATGLLTWYYTLALGRVG